ncbi:MAG TPA: nitroreductase family protein [Gallionellaceae bacterium]|nr:nitroreductase family protein [Gallionellaceae bacterium]
MEVAQAIEQRRSAKVFDPAHRLTEAEVDRLMSLAMLAPTAFNIQHWRFVIVDDPQLRQALRRVSKDQAQVTEASLLVVLCGDLKAWSRDTARYWRTAPADVQPVLVSLIEQYYAGRAQTERDEVMRSCGIAAMALMLAAREMGYESCPMDLSDLDAVGNLLNLPDDHVVSMFVAIGKGIKEPWPRGGQLPMAEVVIRNRFPDHSVA